MCLNQRMYLAALAAGLFSSAARGETPTIGGPVSVSAPTAQGPCDFHSHLGSANAAMVDDVRKLVQLTDAARIQGSIIEQVRARFPGQSEEYWVEFGTLELVQCGLEERLIIAYMGHFTHEDVLALLTFFTSPTGRKLVAGQEALDLSVYEKANEWGLLLVQQVEASVAAANPEAAAPSKPKGWAERAGREH